MLQFNILASYANDNDALIPELWARESIAVLEQNMVMGMLVHRDFSNEIAEFGDVVNTRKPADMVIRRKTDTDTISYNDAVLTNVQVPLNQHMYAGFVIKDGERSKSLQDLIQIHLVPAMKAMGNGIDRAILGRMAHALLGTPATRVGKLEQLSSSTSKDTILEARERMNRTLAHVSNRNLVLAPGSETAILQTELFIAANKRGDGGFALEEARLGRLLGFDTFMDQNVNGILPGSANGRDVTTGGVVDSITLAGVTAAIDTTLAGTLAVVGSWVVIEGNYQPTWLTAVTGTGQTDSITLNEALKYDLAASAPFVIYDDALVDGTYVVGFTKGVVIDCHAADKNLVVGQLVSFGVTTGTRHNYTVIEVLSSTSTSSTVLLDRPLDVAVADGDGAFPGPAGDFNVAFHRNAFALVTRPLARPDSTLGARSFVAVHNDVAMRATMQYDIDAQGTKVVLDLLAGTAVLDSSLATIVLG